nr:uncharacterized protein LOC113804376 [Penaeus vannamei]
MILQFLFIHFLRLLFLWRHVDAAGVPVLPSLLPVMTTTLVGPAEEQAEDRPTPRAVFTLQNNTELRSQVGTTAVLHCMAEHVGENLVSWIRRRDYHLLTVGTHLYSSDDRFQVRYIKEKNDWQLHIRYVQVRDDGAYECQVSSHPPVSLFATLRVLVSCAERVAQAVPVLPGSLSLLFSCKATGSEILGGPEKYIDLRLARWQSSCAS